MNYFLYVSIAEFLNNEAMEQFTICILLYIIRIDIFYE